MKLTDAENLKISLNSIFTPESVVKYTAFYKLINEYDFSNLVNIDHDFINKLFSKTILAFSDYCERNFSSYQLKMMQYSMFRHFVKKISKIISPVIIIEMVPKCFKREFYIRAKCEDKVKCYIFKDYVFRELKEDEYEAKCEMFKENNNDYLEYLDLTEMEF